MRDNFPKIPNTKVNIYRNVMFFVPLLVNVLALALALTLRILWVITHLGKGICPKRNHVRVLAVAGSGGHTTELIRLVESLSSSTYKPRHYVVANTDRMSRKKIEELESRKCSIADKDYYIQMIPRSREVAQPWLSSAWTTVVATIYSFPIMWNSKPDVILCNGPGTCIPLCFVGFIFKVLGITNTQIIFIESICRVESLSLTGLMLYYFADKMFVQWPELLCKYPRTNYIGRIV